jgi:hypothetical protein
MESVGLDGALSFCSEQQWYGGPTLWQPMSIFAGYKDQDSVQDFAGVVAFIS